VLRRLIEPELNAAIGVVHELVEAVLPARPDGLLERIEAQIRAQRAGCLPAHDHAGEGVDDECYVDVAGPSSHVSQIRQPQSVGRLSAEGPVHQAGWWRGCVGGDRGAVSAAPHGPSVA